MRCSAIIKFLSPWMVLRTFPHFDDGGQYVVLELSVRLEMNTG